MKPKREKNLTDLFAQHVLAIFYAGPPPAKKIFSGSAFVMEVLGQWFLVTAGHIIRHMREMRKEAYLHVKLIDGMGYQARYKHAVVLPFDSVETADIGNADDVDYGLIVLNNLTRACLEKNKIIPVTPKEWQRPPKVFDRVFLIGVPGEHIAQKNGLFAFQPLLLALQYIDDPPDSLKKPYPRIYGRISLEGTATEKEPQLTHIEGMSGGPLFGLKTTNGETRYWAIGIQSGWDEKTHTVAACNFKRFADLVQKALEATLKKATLRQTKDTARRRPKK